MANTTPASGGVERRGDASRAPASSNRRACMSPRKPKRRPMASMTPAPTCTVGPRGRSRRRRAVRPRSGRAWPATPSARDGAGVRLRWRSAAITCGMPLPRVDSSPRVVIHASSANMPGVSSSAHHGENAITRLNSERRGRWRGRRRWPRAPPRSRPPQSTTRRFQTSGDSRASRPASCSSCVAIAAFSHARRDRARAEWRHGQARPQRRRPLAPSRHRQPAFARLPARDGGAWPNAKAIRTIRSGPGARRCTASPHASIRTRCTRSLRSCTRRCSKPATPASANSTTCTTRPMAGRTPIRRRCRTRSSAPRATPASA